MTRLHSSPAQKKTRHTATFRAPAPPRCRPDLALRTYLRGQLLDLVLSDAEHGEFGEIADVLLHRGDAVEAQVKRGEGRQPVHHGRDLPQLVVPQVEHLELFKGVQRVGQAGQGVLVESQSDQAGQAAQFSRQALELVAVQVKLSQLR